MRGNVYLIRAGWQRDGEVQGVEHAVTEAEVRAFAGSPHLVTFVCSIMYDSLGVPLDAMWTCSRVRGGQ